MGDTLYALRFKGKGEKGGRGAETVASANSLKHYERMPQANSCNESVLLPLILDMKHT